MNDGLHMVWNPIYGPQDLKQHDLFSRFYSKSKPKQQVQSQEQEQEQGSSSSSPSFPSYILMGKVLFVFGGK
jgi:hypothetical protein